MIHTSLSESGVGGYFSQFVFQSATLPSGISFRKDVLPFGTDKLHVMDDIHV